MAMKPKKADDPMEMIEQADQEPMDFGRAEPVKMETEIVFISLVTCKVSKAGTSVSVRAGDEVSGFALAWLASRGQVEKQTREKVKS